MIEVSKAPHIELTHELVFRQIVYKKLQDSGFEPRGAGGLKSGESLGGGMVKDDLEIICSCFGGMNSISICLPVDDAVRQDRYFKRINFDGRSVLISTQDFSTIYLCLGALDIEADVDDGWAEIEKNIQHGFMILYYNKEHVYKDFVEKKDESKKRDIPMIRVATAGAIIGVLLDHKVASDIFGFLSSHGVDTPDSVREYVASFARYPILARAFWGAWTAGIAGAFLEALKNGILKTACSLKDGKNK